MTSILSRFMNYAFPNFWPFSSFKRAREELEENDENFDYGSSPTKKVKLHIPSLAARSLKEVNRPTVTRVRKRHLSDKSPIDLNNDISMAKRNSLPKLCEKSKRNSQRSFNLSESIDLTDDDPRENTPNGIPYIDITDDDHPITIEADSIIGNVSGSRRGNRRPQSSLMRMGLSRMSRSNRNHTSKLELTNSLRKNREKSMFAPVWPTQSYDLEERMNFGRLLGTYVINNSTAGPLSTSITTEVIDLSKDDDEEKSFSTVPGPSNRSSMDLKKTPTVPKKFDSDTNATISSSTKKGTKSEIMRVNSFEKLIKEKQCTKEEWVENFMKHYNETREDFLATRDKFQRDIKVWDEENKRTIETLLEEKLTNHLRITEAFIPEEPYPPIIRDFPEMTQEMIGKVRRVCTEGTPGTVLIQKYNYSIKKCDIATLQNMNWLNDEVINFYMVLIQKRSEEREEFPLTYCQSTFFYSTLKTRGYNGVKRWTRKINIFDYEIFIIPIHLQVHWCLVTIDLKKKEINFYDSMGNPNNPCLLLMSNYLKEEHKSKMGSELDLAEWSISSVKNVPLQMNGSDCGVFACTYAEFSSRRAPFNFSQDHMPYLRRRMTYEIITGELLIS